MSVPVKGALAGAQVTYHYIWKAFVALVHLWELKLSYEVEIGILSQSVGKHFQ